MRINGSEYSTDEHGNTIIKTYADDPYDEDRLVSETMKRGNHERTTLYDKSGKVTSRISIDEGIVTNKHVYENGRETSRYSFDKTTGIAMQDTYLYDEEGHLAETIIEKMKDGKIISKEKATKDGRVDLLKTENLQDVENTTLPAVRGQEMPARTQETQQEQPDLHPVRVEQTAETVNTVLPAVRGNEMPERAQEPIVLEGQEANLVQSLGNYAQKPSKESFEAFALDLSNLVSEYRASGMSLSDATQKASEFLGQLYDRAEGQNLDPQMLANLRNAKEAANKFMAQAAEASNAGPTMLNEVNAGRQDENIEDVEFEEIPAAPVAENEGNEEVADTPVAPANENEGSEEAADTPAAPANENEGNEEAADTPAAPENENEGNDEAGTPAAPENESEGNNVADAPAPENGTQGTFGFIENEPENVNTTTTENGPAAEPARTSDLKQQLLDTAFKNRYMLVEAENEEPQRMCPFAQLKVRTIEDKSDDEKNPYVKMELESGNRIYNRPNQVDVHYDTFVTQDENGNTVKKPQITFEDCMAAVRVGMEKGWTSATLSGPDAYKEQMYLAMCAMGMKVVGYEPSEELKKEGERLAKLHAVDRDHAASVDQRFDALEAARKEAGIKEPEDVGKEFIDDMKKQGLGYDAKIESITRTVTHHRQLLDDDGKPTAEEVYDSNGNKISSKTFDKDGNYQGENYDKDGNVIQKIDGRYVDDPELGQKYFSESVFDLDGNIVSREDTYADGSKFKSDFSSGKDLYFDADGNQITDFENNTSIAAQKKKANEEKADASEQTQANEGNDEAGTPAAPTNENEGNDEAGTPAAPTNENEGNDEAGTPAAPAVKNEGQEAVQQPQQLQLPEHVEQQQPQQLQLPAHEEQQQPQTALVPATPEIQNKMEAVALTSTTALAKTDPVKAQQAAVQIAATPGIANQLQLAGKTANEAKGNDVKAAQQQRQQETALVLAARNNNHTK